METTHESGFGRTRHAVVVNDPIWQGVQNLSKYAPVIKPDRYACYPRRNAAWHGGVSLLPHHSDTGHELEACCVT